MFRSNKFNKNSSDFIESGKANLIIYGQFGSTGKGLIAAYIAENNFESNP